MTTRPATATRGSTWLPARRRTARRPRSPPLQRPATHCRRGRGARRRRGMGRRLRDQDAADRRQPVVHAAPCTPPARPGRRRRTTTAPGGECTYSRRSRSRRRPPARCATSAPSLRPRSPTSMPGDVVVFPAHGVTADVRAEAARRGATVIDATCPLVAAAQTAASRTADRGQQLVLIGQPGQASTPCHHEPGTRARHRRRDAGEDGRPAASATPGTSPTSCSPVSRWRPAPRS